MIVKLYLMPRSFLLVKCSIIFCIALVSFILFSVLLFFSLHRERECSGSSLTMLEIEENLQAAFKKLRVDSEG